MTQRLNILIEHDIPLPPEQEEEQPEVELLPARPSAFTSESGREATDIKREKQRVRKERLSAAFLDDLIVAWNERGKQALEAIALHAPDKFVQVVANLVTKHEVITLEQTGGGISIDAIGLQEVSRRTRELLTRAAARSDPAVLPD